MADPRAEYTRQILESIITKLMEGDEHGVHLTMEEVALLIAWLQEAGLVKR